MSTAGWRKGFIYFENEPLMNVIERLEQQFAVEVDYPPSQGPRTIDGFFSADNLDSALNDVTYPLNLKFRRQGNRVVITE